TAQVKEAEHTVEKLEQDMQALEDSLLLPDVYNDHVAAQRISQDIARLRESVDAAYIRWEKAEEELTRETEVLAENI
ncbi:MAG TPA: hypothetical protein GX722_10215, partial [Clostridiales bacterium]|nr:hypothetical protein [Clostridiales bacterium]